MHQTDSGPLATTQGGRQVSQRLIRYKMEGGLLKQQQQQTETQTSKHEPL